MGGGRRPALAGLIAAAGARSVYPRTSPRHPLLAREGWRPPACSCSPCGRPLRSASATPPQLRPGGRCAARHRALHDTTCRRRAQPASSGRCSGKAPQAAQPPRPCPRSLAPRRPPAGVDWRARCWPAPASKWELLPPPPPLPLRTRPRRRRQTWRSSRRLPATVSERASEHEQLVWSLYAALFGTAACGLSAGGMHRTSAAACPRACVPHRSLPLPPSALALALAQTKRMAAAGRALRGRRYAPPG